jgi:DNA-binding NarL/FixJ family response regulator
MSDVLIASSFDYETGHTTERPLTDEEIAERQLKQQEAETNQAQQNAKAAARESALAKLADLGLTAEEIAAL